MSATLGCLGLDSRHSGIRLNSGQLRWGCYSGDYSVHRFVSPENTFKKIENLSENRRRLSVK